MTNGDHIELESSLEHNLLRRLDRDPQITRFVAQPFRLAWAEGRRHVGHTPDLLAIHDDGAVTVWDARAVDKQDAAFTTKAEITRAACGVVGWGYELFSGLSEIELLNLLWLHGFRHRRDWFHGLEEKVRHQAKLQGATIGSVFAIDDDMESLKSVMWHMIWRGDLTIDFSASWDLPTPIGVCKEASRV